MHEAHVHIQPWSFPLVATCTLVIVALVYWRGWLSLRGTFRDHFPAWRLAAFIAGLITVWAAIESPVATLDHQSLTMHMVKHLLLMTVAAPLILAGAPALRLLNGLPCQLIPSNLLPGRMTAGPLGRFITHPALCWLAATATVIGWHLPVAFQLALQFHWIHCVENTCFLLAGLLFWLPIMRPLPNMKPSPRWSMALYLFLATLPCDILSAFLAFCGRVVYPSYLSAPRLFNMSPLQDQECAGALMWVGVTFAYLLPTVFITVQILSPRGSHSQKQAHGAVHSVEPLSLRDPQVEVY